MPSPGHESYRRTVLEWFRAHALERDVIADLERFKDAALVLWHLDLDPASPSLRSCYAQNPRGGDPWEALVVLRCLLLGALVGEPRINRWVPILKASRVLRVLCGLPPEGAECAGVGTLYDFLHRLHDGPIRQACEHQARPSEAERRRARTARVPQPKPGKSDKPETKRTKKSQRSRRSRRQDPVQAEAKELGATEKLLAELKATRDNPNPNDLLERLSALLLEVGAMESARRGLLGKLRLHPRLAGLP